MLVSAIQFGQNPVQAFLSQVCFSVSRYRIEIPVEIPQLIFIPCKIILLKIHHGPDIPAAISKIVEGIHEPTTVPYERRYPFIQYIPDFICKLSVHYLRYLPAMYRVRIFKSPTDNSNPSLTILTELSRCSITCTGILTRLWFRRPDINNTSTSNEKSVRVTFSKIDLAVSLRKPFTPHCESGNPLRINRVTIAESNRLPTVLAKLIFG